MAPAVLRGTGARIEEVPDGTLLRFAAAGAVALRVRPAPDHGRNLAASDDFGARRQEVLQQRATAAPIATDIDKLGHRQTGINPPLGR